MAKSKKIVEETQEVVQSPETRQRVRYCPTCGKVVYSPAEAKGKPQMYCEEHRRENRRSQNSRAEKYAAALDRLTLILSAGIPEYETTIRANLQSIPRASVLSAANLLSKDSEVKDKSE